MATGLWCTIAVMHRSPRQLDFYFDDDIADAVYRLGGFRSGRDVDGLVHAITPSRHTVCGRIVQIKLDLGDPNPEIKCVECIECADRS